MGWCVLGLRERLVGQPAALRANGRLFHWANDPRHDNLEWWARHIIEITGMPVKRVINPNSANPIKEYKVKINPKVRIYPFAKHSMKMMPINQIGSNRSAKQGPGSKRDDNDYGELTSRCVQNTGAHLTEISSSQTY